MDHDYSALPLKEKVSKDVIGLYEVLIKSEQDDSFTQVESVEVVQSSECRTSHTCDADEQAMHHATEDIMPTASEEDILRRHLLDLKKRGNMWTGYAPSREAFVDLQLDLAAINVSFQTECSTSSKGRLLFSSQRGYVVINEDVPFKVVRKVIKGCVFGRVTKRMKESSSKQEKGPDCSTTTSKPRKFKPHGTKKRGCTAVMHVKQVEAYPEFKVDLSKMRARWERHTASKEALSKLKAALQEEESGKPVLRQHRFYISMPDAESHCNHNIGADGAGSALTVNSDVAKKIAQLVQEGVTSAKTVETRLRLYVRDVLFANKQCPLATRRDFYPTRANIQNHIHRALQKYRSLCPDQENVAAYVELLQEEAPATSSLFYVHQVETAEAQSREQDKRQETSADSDILKTAFHAACEDRPYLAALDTTNRTLSEMEENSEQLVDEAVVSDTEEDCEQSAQDAAESHASDLPSTSQQTTRTIKTQIRAECTKVFSSLRYLHDHAVLHQLLSLLTAAKDLAQVNMATANGIKRKKRKKMPADLMKVKDLQVKMKSLPPKQRHGRVRKKAAVTREAYEAPNLVRVVVRERAKLN